MIVRQLLAVQTELKAPKNQYNSFGKYKYRNCEDILNAAKPLLKKNDLLLTISDSMDNIGGKNYIVATAKVTNSDGDSVEVKAQARESENKKGMDDSQITGTASSYARKYALNGLFLIDDSKCEATPDPDSDAHHEAVNQKKEKIKCSDCKNEIKDGKTRHGEVWPAEGIAAYSKRGFGRELCIDCLEKAVKAENGN